jgi:hypothetical protein
MIDSYGCYPTYSLNNMLYIRGVIGSIKSLNRVSKIGAALVCLFTVSIIRYFIPFEPSPKNHKFQYSKYNHLVNGIFLNYIKHVIILNQKNFGIELSSQEVPLQVLSSIYSVSQLSSIWISVVPLSTLETPKQKSTFNC